MDDRLVDTGLALTCFGLARIFGFYIRILRGHLADHQPLLRVASAYYRGLSFAKARPITAV